MEKKEQVFVKSRFNFMSRSDDGELIMYNSYTGAIVSFSQEEEAEVLACLDGQGAAGAMAEALAAQGFLVPAGTDELRRAQFLHQSLHRTDMLHLYILPTEQCNFRCVYCYEDFKRGKMTEETKEGLKKFVAEKAKTLRHFCVSWYGGEPLLAHDVIGELSESFLETCGKYGVEYDADIATNGYLLTERLFRKLLDWNVRQYMITLDGPAEKHNSRRMLCGGAETGKGSFSRIVENLKAMKAVDGDFKVSLRVNFDHDNLESIPGFIPTLSEWFGGDMRFQTFFRPVNRLGGPNDDKLPICDLATRDVKMWEFTRMGLEQGLGMSTLIEGMLMPSASVCTTAKPYTLVIASDGNIYKCIETLERADINCLGRLHADGTAEIDQDKLAFWVTSGEETDEHCQACSFRPACQGNFCPMHRLRTGERPCSNEYRQIGKVLSLIHSHHAILEKQGLALELPVPTAGRGSL